MIKNFCLSFLAISGLLMAAQSCKNDEENEEVVKNEADPVVKHIGDLVDEELENDTNVVCYQKIDFASSNGLKSVSDGSNLKGYLQDLRITTNKTATFEGYKKIDVDLNMGAGGNWVYLWYQTTHSIKYALTDIRCSAYSTYGLTCRKYSIVNDQNDNPGDCNAGTGARPIYIGQIRDESDLQNAITSIEIVAYKHKANDKIYRNGKFYYRTRDDLDLNQGAGGRYIYIFLLRDKDM